MVAIGGTGLDDSTNGFKYLLTEGFKPINKPKPIPAMLPTKNPVKL